MNPANTIAKIAAPGGTNQFHAPRDNAWFAYASCNITPHDIDAGSPNPRNEAAASANIAHPIATDPYNAANGNTCGRICTNMIRAFEHPVTRAASTHARSRKLNTWLRITRAVFGHNSAVTVNITVPVPGRVNDANTSIVGKNGNPNTTSASRVIALSTHPPRYPANNPNNVPIATTANAAVNPTSSAVRAPWINWLAISIPLDVVPSQNSPEAGKYRAIRRFARMISVGLCGAIRSANTAAATITA